MSDDSITADTHEEEPNGAGSPMEEAQTIDEIVDVLLDESNGESEEPSPETGAGATGIAEEELDDFGDGGGVAVLADGAEAGPDDWQDGPLVTVIGSDGHDDDRGDEDMLVSLPQDTTIITQGTVTASDSEAETKKARRMAESGVERYRVSMGAMFATLFVGLAIGVVATFLVMRGEMASDESPADKVSVLPASIEKSKLSTQMVSYEYDGATCSMSVRDVIEATGSLDSMKSDGDMYSVPSTEKAVEAVRNAVVLAEAEKHGIEVSDGDIQDYVLDSYGVATVEELSQQVGLAPEETERQLKERLVIRFLKREVTGAQELVPLVEPMAPDDGDSTMMTERYGEYIRSLAGDEWNSTDNVWTDPDGMFAQAFSENMFDGHVASYDMAKTAYDVVRRKNEAIQSNIDKAWSDYLNELFRKVHITIMTLSR